MEYAKQFQTAISRSDGAKLAELLNIQQLNSDSTKALAASCRGVRIRGFSSVLPACKCNSLARVYNEQRSSCDCGL